MENQFQQVSWLSRSNVYEVNLRQYTENGTLMSFKEHLPRLKDMGVDVLWFMPLTPISFKNRKGSLGSYYASSSYNKINPEFGDFTDFEVLVNEAHEMGLKVIIDWVANHTGCDHEWTISNPSFYKKNNEGEFYDAHGWDDVIDLDYQNQEMRLAMINCMQLWIDKFNIDGFRCDMAMLTPVGFWHQARNELDKIKPLFWLAELDPLDNPDYMEIFDSAYTWRWMNTSKNLMQEGANNIHSLRSVLDSYKSSLPVNVYPAWFTSNHDENSWNGTEYEKYGDMALPLAVFSSMWKGLPLLYSGQELPNLKRLNFFDKDKIEWDVDVKLHHFYKQLFLFRKQHKVFGNNEGEVICEYIGNSVDHHILSFVRKFHGIEVFVMINFSQYTLSHVEVATGQAFGIHHELFSNNFIEFKHAHQYFDFNPWSFQIWYK